MFYHTHIGTGFLRSLTVFIFSAAIGSVYSETLSLKSGKIEYRLVESDGSYVVDYLGPIGDTSWPEAEKGYWHLNPPKRFDLRMRVEDQDYDTADFTHEAPQQTTEGKTNRTRVLYRHKELPLQVRVDYTAAGDTGVFSRKITVTNQGDKPLRIDSLPSLTWRLPAGEYELTYLYGGWGREMQPMTEPITVGTRQFISRRGRSTNGYNPWFCLSNNDLGLKFMGQLAYSGNWEMMIERSTPETYRQEDIVVELGIRFDEGGPLTLGPGLSFEAPAAAFTATDGSLDDAANQLHRYQREFVIPTTPTNDPLLVQYNTWYAYSDKLKVADLKKTADTAAELGCELFIVDAGWFNKKNWSTEIGDWQVDKTAFPNGLEELSDHVHSQGMKFGLWFEIENLGIDSQMSRAHPEWCLSKDGKAILFGERYQLNFAIPEARQWARNVLHDAVQQYKLDWVKLDYNVDIHESFDPMKGFISGDTLYRHLTAYYAFLDDLRHSYPNLVVESCSSGGLRFDLGIMRHAHTTWISDVVEPWQSLQLAYGSTMQFAPAVCNHWMVGEKSDGKVDLSQPAGWWDFMFRVPMNGQFGISSRVWEWNDALKERAKENVRIYKSIRDIIQTGDVYHLTECPDHDKPEYWMAIQYVTPDQQRSAVLAYRLEGGDKSNTFFLKNLNEGQYRVRIDGKDAGQVSGQECMENGLPVSLDEEWRAAVIEMEAVK